EITSENLPEKMFPGMLISYKIRPLLGIPVRWTTIITEVGEPDYFVDEQQKGPYHTWRHEHRMRTIPGAVEMEDRVYYQPPMGILGKLANTLFLRRQLESIFDYRYKAIERRFGKFNAG
ncbi:MAG: SRPBCC family protein, partial [Bacteroidetes bacterium]|nr:SRPBCC family protein [Bacteroidota bacterium]